MNEEPKELTSEQVNLLNYVLEENKKNLIESLNYNLSKLRDYDFLNNDQLEMFKIQLEFIKSEILHNILVSVEDQQKILEVIYKFEESSSDYFTFLIDSLYYRIEGCGLCDDEDLVK